MAGSEVVSDHGSFQCCHPKIARLDNFRVLMALIECSLTPIFSRSLFSRFAGLLLLLKVESLHWELVSSHMRKVCVSPFQPIMSRVDIRKVSQVD